MQKYGIVSHTCAEPMGGASLVFSVSPTSGLDASNPSLPAVMRSPCVVLAAGLGVGHTETVWVENG